MRVFNMLISFDPIILLPSIFPEEITLNEEKPLGTEVHSLLITTVVFCLQVSEPSPASRFDLLLLSDRLHAYLAPSHM